MSKHDRRPATEAPRKPEQQGRAGQRPDRATVAETVYTCPMHPEVRQSSPGTCPKCGMALVRK